MSDELDARVRALEAERLRPVPPPPKRPFRPNPARAAPPEVIAALVAEVTRADGRTRTVRGTVAERLEDYAFLRGQGEGVEEAARRIGITAKQAREKYEPKLHEMEPS